VRSYSLSAAPAGGSYRISVKHEPHGAASGYLTSRLRPGMTLDVAAPRGDFTLEDGTGPVLLLSAGIGVTPVLAMLHRLAAGRSRREVWWIHGARGPQEHPLAAEAHALLAALPRAHEHVFYSAAPDTERPGWATARRLSKDSLAALAVPATASAYVCGPASFMADMQQALTAIGIDPARIRTELFAALPSVNPGLTGQARRPPHQPPGPPGNRAAGDLRPQRHRCAVRQRPAQRARSGRRLRRADPVELPHRRVPHLQHTPALRRHLLLPGPRGAPAGRGGAHLLRPAPDRHRAAHVRRRVMDHLLQAVSVSVAVPAP
jgi:ferredoxin-NADP reductase